ncbi:MAG: wax ester/triacylglycerol synthase family O-acyltransferase [Chloroflexota bacterium]|nr:MAG: wax ester/triacylglycerol synthase family O-acyltransferase [Chloroflexota bacterium]
MEDPTNLMMISGIFMFDEPIEFESLRAVIEARLLKFRRFRQKVAQPPLSIMAPIWIDDPRFDVDAHLHRIALPSPGNQFALQKLTNDLMSTPLDFSKPLWQIHLVEGFGDGCALVCRLHHCIADGIALMRVLLSLTDDTVEVKNESEPMTADQDGRSSGQDTAPAGGAATYGARLMSQGLDMLADRERRRAAARMGAEGAAALANLLLLSPDPPTPLKGSLGVQKRCAWSFPIPLDDVKAVGRVTGGTVNDVLLTAVAGALGRYLRSRGETIGGLNLRAVVPVNLRPPDEPLKLGNTFGLVFLSLPVGIDDPLDRLIELKRRMDTIKGTPEALVTFGILNAMGAAGPQVEDIVVSIFEKKATTVMTNVPGPKEVRYFAGKPIKGIMFWVPQSGRLGLGVSILSYAGEVLVGIASDAGLTPDPESIVEAIHVEFDSLMQLVTWARQADAQLEETPINQRCLGQTKSGRQCKNRPQPGEEYCHLHRQE